MSLTDIIRKASAYILGPEDGNYNGAIMKYADNEVLFCKNNVCVHPPAMVRQVGTHLASCHKWPRQYLNYLTEIKKVMGSVGHQSHDTYLVRTSLAEFLKTRKNKFSELFEVELLPLFFNFFPNQCSDHL